MIGPVTPLRDQAFQTHVAGRPDQDRPYFALLNRSDDDAIGLTREVEALRERLAAVEGEIERLTGSPVAAPKAWLRRKLERGRSR